MQSTHDSISQPHETARAGRVVSVNVGVPRSITWHGREVTSAIWKAPVSGMTSLRGINLDGDDQADRQVHGGADKAVYAYALDDYRFWTSAHGIPSQPGLFGENLTIDGLQVSHALIGERWQVGTAVLEVSQPRIPCYKLGIRLQDPEFPRRFAAAGRPGAYLRIVQAGFVTPGDGVSVVYRPEHGVTAELVARAYHADRSLLPLLVDLAELTPSWREWAQHMLDAAQRRASA